MRIRCRCASCGATYQVEQQFAGRKIKCPKCSAVIVVAAVAEPEAAAPKAPAGPNPLKVAEKIEPEAPAAAWSGSDGAPEDAGSDAVAVPGLDEAAPKRSALGASARKHRGKKKKADNRLLWIAASLVAGTLAIAAVVVAVAIQTSKPGPTPAAVTANRATTTRPAPVENAPPPSTMLVLNWPESARADAVVYIDGSPMKVPQTGPVEYPLEIQAGSHKIRITRKGFHSLEFPRMSVAGEQLPAYTVRWFRSFDDWVQDFDEAKRLAAAGKKPILILFDGSDWAPNSEPLMREIFSKEEFLKGPGKDCVLMYVDFPHNAEGAAKVKSRERNEALAQQFQVKDYPTVVLTQQDGKPIGFLQVHVAGDLKAFLKLFQEWRTTGEKLRALTKDIETAKDEAKRRAICDAWDLLASSDLDRYYAQEIERWKAMLPADQRDRKHPATAAETDRWIARFERHLEMGGGEGAVEMVAEFDQWKQARSFADANVAARLHFLAAALLYRSKQPAGAAKKVDEALKFDITDDELRQNLEGFKAYLAENGENEGERLRGRGTGSFVAEGGYLVTNHHVVEGHKKLKVRLARTGQVFPAKLIAEDAQVDLALVKAEIPAGVKVTPVSLLPGVKEGQAICAIGFPTTGDPRENFGKPRLVITQGIISGVPDPSDKKAMIELDCRVNPGNSGGPLFNSLGVVVGVIRAKTFTMADRDSIGLAIPGEKVVAFLKQNLPAPTKLPPAKPAAKPLEWTQLKEQMEASIVCVQNYQ